VNELTQGGNEMISKQSFVEDFLEHSSKLFLATRELSGEIVQASEIISNCLNEGGKVLWCGNGGSAADSQHLAAELVGRYKLERKALASVALTTDTSVLTAISNDYSFEQVYARQVEALGTGKDVLVALSTSGRSPSILKALEVAKTKGLITIFLTSNRADVAEASLAIKVNETRTEHIQHVHLAIGHVICELVELGIQ
jgi:D-sedoheptulose 7-phosphate isomerase